MSTEVHYQWALRRQSILECLICWHLFALSCPIQLCNVQLPTVSPNSALEYGAVSERTHRLKYILPQEDQLQQSVGLQALAAPGKHDSTWTHDPKRTRSAQHELLTLNIQSTRMTEHHTVSKVKCLETAKSYYNKITSFYKCMKWNKTADSEIIHY